ncbi:unannotated protein [freshwater metagenome]|uniref:Unannotated protein n=1 Tax=freshwater metagenome TaxID=449393 RepID=A0A6J6E427_9ZZZZ
MICWRFSMSMAACKPGISKADHIPSLVKATPKGVFSITSSAFAYATSNNSDSEMTEVTSPIVRASVASKRRPVNINSWARAAPTNRGKSQLVPMSHADNPIRINAALNRAEVAAIRISDPRTSAKPPPEAGPFTAAITGCGSDLRCGIRDAMCFCTAKPFSTAPFHA